jgi:hypothetical protein
MVQYSQHQRLKKQNKKIYRAYQAWQEDSSGKDSERNKLLWQRWQYEVRRLEQLMEKFE